MSVGREVFVFPVNTQRDPGHAMLREALQVHHALEKARGARELLVHVNALLGAALWFIAVWPHAVSTDLRVSALAAWIPCFGGLLIAAVCERLLQRRHAAALLRLERSQ